MPGYSSECETGMHAACAMGIECRCLCHQHTQALLRKGNPKPDRKGGLRRKVKMPQVPAVPQRRLPAPAPPPMELIAPSEPQESELHNTCPKCRARAKPTDVFCRKDGTRLCMGKPCPRCEAPCEESDAFCWQCSWKLGDPMPTMPEQIEVSPELAESLREQMRSQPGSLEAVSASGSQPAEDPIVRLRRKAQEQGLLPRETIVS
jgi:hypothetical protein